MALSLDRVADRAGVSKGGLLYHFNTKEAMMAALMQSAIEEHEQMIAERVKGGERYTDAVIDACVDKCGPGSNLMAGFVAAVATDRRAQELIRERKRGWQEALVQDGVPKDKALVLSLALDGLFIGQSLGITDLSDEDRIGLRHGLTQLICPDVRSQMAEWFSMALERLEAEDVATPKVEPAS